MGVAYSNAGVAGCGADVDPSFYFYFFHVALACLLVVIRAAQKERACFVTCFVFNFAAEPWSYLSFGEGQGDG